MRLFLDTGVLVAAALPRDQHHARGAAVMERVAGGEWTSVHTSDYVLAEALNFVRGRVGRLEAAEGIIRPVFGHPEAPPVVSSILRITSPRFASALDRYRRQFDRGLSVTDWTTVVAMADEGIHQLATFDRGFQGVVDVVG